MTLKQLGPNQTEVESCGNLYLFSYETGVAMRYNGKFYRTTRKWSQTTSNHINNWLKCYDNPETEYITQEELDTGYFKSL